MTVMRVTGGEDGTVEQMISTSGGVRRDSDYADTGVKITSGFGSKTVHSADQIGDNDLVVIDGMEITGKMAREMGLLGRVFDEPLSSSALAKGATDAQQARVADEPTKQETGVPDYDDAIARLEAEIDNGTMTLEEAREYDTSLAQIAMSGLSVDAVVDTLDGLASGTVDATEVPGDVKSMIRDVETSVTEAATASVKSEIGGEGFAELQRAAAASPEVNAAIRNYAIMRATGRAEGITWSDFLADVRDHLAGRA